MTGCGRDSAADVGNFDTALTYFLFGDDLFLMDSVSEVGGVGIICRFPTDLTRFLETSSSSMVMISMSVSVVVESFPLRFFDAFFLFFGSDWIVGFLFGRLLYDPLYKCEIKY